MSIHSSEVEGSDPKKTVIAISNHILQKKKEQVYMYDIFFTTSAKKNVGRILFQIHFTPTCRLSAQQGKNHWQQQFQGVTPVESIIGKICIDPHSLPKIRKDANKKVTRFSWGKKVTDIQ